MKIEKIKINEALFGQRLDKFLSFVFQEKSRSELKKRIKNKEVFINKKQKTEPDYILKKGDEVKIIFQDKEEKVKINASEIKLKIIYEDDDVIIIDKPAGIISHKTKENLDISIVDFLILRYPKIKAVGGDILRAGIVHRLDKDTSGIMIAAKNSAACEFLRKQFDERNVFKEYTALVYGAPKPKNGIITFRIGRSKTKQNMQTVVNSEKKFNIKSREAVTIYKTIMSYEKYSLLKVFPKTGRMHQIRVHLKAIGHPVVGDKKYVFRKLFSGYLSTKRQFLHASKLIIKLPNGRTKEFKSNLPQDLEAFLKNLPLRDCIDN